MKYFIGFILTALILNACSKEESVPQINTISGSISVSDVENQIEDEYLMFGLFTGNSSAPDYSTRLTIPAGNQAIDFSITGVKKGTYTPKVYIAEERKINKAVLYTFNDVVVEEDQQLTSVSIQLLSYKRIQEQVLNNCLLCHGTGSDIEADLYLTSDKSYDALINIPSVLEEGEILVKPNDPEASYLVTVLRNQHTGFDHSYSSIIPEADIVLVEKWINNGANND